MDAMYWIKVPPTPYFIVPENHQKLVDPPTPRRDVTIEQSPVPYFQLHIYCFENSIEALKTLVLRSLP